jgi:hypothetical protein
VRQPSVVTEADQLEVDTRISQELQLLDVLDHGPGDWRPVSVPRDSESAVPLKIVD